MIPRFSETHRAIFRNTSCLLYTFAERVRQETAAHLCTHVHVLRTRYPALRTHLFLRNDVRQIAQLADGFVTARQGGTVVMVSAVSDRSEMDESGFLPLSVDYREKVRTDTKKEQALIRVS